MSRPSKPVPPDARAVIRQACRVNADLEAQDDRMEKRRQLWAQARSLGATQRSIAEACGVSESLVKLEVARFRGAAWAVGACGG